MTSTAMALLDNNESGLTGWVVTLTGGATTLTTTTNISGTYTFTGIGPGSYTLSEVLQGGFVPTAPAGGTQTLVISNGVNVTGVNFGDFQPVSVSGEVYTDTNGNGSLDSGETGLAGWVVTLASGTTTLTATTSASGTYTFTGVGPGYHVLSQAVQSGFVATTGSLAFYPSSGTNVTNENFGDFQPVSVSGEVYNDVNGNGALDSGESGLGGWTVNLTQGGSTLSATTSTVAPTPSPASDPARTP